jgi:Reverse transcriptase (RNA-dependent DNA polymerase)
VPKNFRQARKSKEYQERWLPVIQRQFDSLESEEVWSLVPLEPTMNVLPGKWVYDKKIDITTGQYDARARWVVCGNYEDNSWSIQDVYATVASLVSVKTFMALTAVKDLECH